VLTPFVLTPILGSPVVLFLSTNFRTISDPKIGARTKRVSTSDEGRLYDDDIDLSIYEKMVVPVHPPERTRKDPKLVDYSQYSNDIKPLSFQDPRALQDLSSVMITFGVPTKPTGMNL
jgi:hypothetical protein